MHERCRSAGQGGQLSAAGQDAAGHRQFTILNCRLVAAACFAAVPGPVRTLMAREADWAQISLPSGEIRRVPSACRATDRRDEQRRSHAASCLGKAGRKRWMGRRPHVRGTAMNPIDHPHGGGEGRTKGGRHPVSPRARVPRVERPASAARHRTRRSFVGVRVDAMVS